MTSIGHSNADFGDDLLLRAERSPAGLTKPKKNKKSPRGRQACRMRKRIVRVRDLGLGYDSDETVLFKYCSGACYRSRTNYDLTLSHLLKQKTISQAESDRVSSHPCCRPMGYENVTFFQSSWQIIEGLSAANCGCVG